ncbi:MAG TPA: exodeoxyribonuclease VII large subunit [Pyrinomonadaceae bacterium]|nr:exodeoxyribonuclease VII large subunit [Pyrinomonadaceae bacterium]
MTQPSLLQSLFDEQERRPLTVAELNAQVKRELEKSFASVWVEGEITNFISHRSGHWYFSLNGDGAQVKAACFKSSNWKIRFEPSDGLTVRVRGKLTVYEPRGEYQLMVESLEPVGEGALRVAFEQIKAKLAAEGLFAVELKRTLPLLPRRVGVITSPTGAAYHDILTVLTRRTRSVSIVLIPTKVQGENAGEEIREAVLFANRFNAKAIANEKIDVLIVGRGGGSSEDLWAFNEERLARAIHASKIPVISAVGHEVDFTICDFVADLRAATPSAAAEIVAACEEHLLEFIRSKTQDMEQAVSHKLLELSLRYQALELSPVFIDFPNEIDRLKCDLDDLSTQLQDAFAATIDRASAKLDRFDAQLTPLSLTSKLGLARTSLAVFDEKNRSAMRRILNCCIEHLGIGMASLDALSPLSVLNRGYSITQKRSGEVVRDPSNVSAGEKVDIRVAKGKIRAEVLSTDRSE